MKKNFTTIFMALGLAILPFTNATSQEKTVNRNELSNSSVNYLKDVYQQQVKNQHAKVSVLGCDTVNFGKAFIKPYKWTASGWRTGTAGASGFISGINKFNDMENANFIDLSSYAAGSKISSVLLLFWKAYTTNTSKTITIKVYDDSGASGLPGAVPLGSQTISMANIMSDVQNNRFTTAVFSTPITVPASKKIYVSFDMSQLTWTQAAGTDSLALYATSQNQENPGIAWVKTAAGAWESYMTNWKLDQMALYMFPCITTNATAPVASVSVNPSNGVVCAGSLITMDYAGSVHPYGLFWSANTGFSTPSYSGTKIMFSYNTPGNYSYTQSSYGCGYVERKTINLTVKASPTVNAVAASSYCGGASVPAVILNSTPSGASFSWSNNNTSIGLAASGTGDVSAFTATNLANTSAITGTVSVTPVLNGCTGPALTYNVSVKPVPSMGGLSNATACHNTSYTAPAFNSVPSGATFSWTNSNTAIGLAASGAGNLPAFTATTGAANTSGTISVIPTLNGCAGNSSNFAIAVSPLPNIAASSSKDTICNGSSANLSASGGGISYQWTPATGLNNAAIASPVASPTATTDYTVQTTDNNGCSANKVIRLTVKNCVGIHEQQISDMSIAYDQISRSYYLLSANLSGNALIQIFNSIGQETFNQQLPINAPKIELNTGSLSSGIYYVRCSINNKVFNSKIKLE